jgi:hypothetical protein
MTTMPRGQPRSVPDEAGEQYDREMARVRAQRQAEDGGQSPTESQWKISRPNTLLSLVPVVGPAWEAAADFQDGDYAGAAVNAAFAVADLAPAGVALKGANAIRKGVGAWKKGSVTADAARKVIRGRKLAGSGEEIHHSIPLNGLGRNTQDWRNHYAFLKTMPKEQHRRLTGSWDGKPRYNAAQRAWFGTTDWMKAYPLYGVDHVGLAVERSGDKP